MSNLPKQDAGAKLIEERMENADLRRKIYKLEGDIKRRDAQLEARAAVLEAERGTSTRTFDRLLAVEAAGRAAIEALRAIATYDEDPICDATSPSFNIHVATQVGIARNALAALRKELP